MYIVGFNAQGVMHRPITLRPGQMLLDARNAMIRYSIGRVVIAEQDRPVGIITEKDIAQFLYQKAPAGRLDETRVDEVMSKDLATVGPDADLKTCARLMLEKKISSLLVVGPDHRLKGILTKSDLTAAYVEYFSLKHKVRNFMTSHVFTVSPGESIHAAMMVMAGNEISRVVVSDNNRPVGIITTRDLLPLGSFFAGEGAWQAGARERRFIPSGVKARLLVSDVMTPNPMTTGPDSDLADPAYVMVRNRISGLPVVGPRGELAGIVTKTDTTRAMASDAQ